MALVDEKVRTLDNGKKQTGLDIESDRELVKNVCDAGFGDI